VIVWRIIFWYTCQLLPRDTGSFFVLYCYCGGVLSNGYLSWECAYRGRRMRWGVSSTRRVPGFWFLSLVLTKFYIGCLCFWSCFGVGSVILCGLYILLGRVIVWWVYLDHSFLFGWSKLILIKFILCKIEWWVLAHFTTSSLCLYSCLILSGNYFRIVELLMAILLELVKFCSVQCKGCFGCKSEDVCVFFVYVSHNLNLYQLMAIKILALLNRYAGLT